MKLKTALVFMGLGLLTCHQAILTAPEGTKLYLSVNPLSIPANGGKAEVSALLIEPAGTPVADGTVVQFFTTLGRIDEQGKTNDGVARVNLVSDSRSGTATVTAYSGLATATPASQDVKIGTLNVTEVVVTADPPRITASRSSHIFAYVRDKDGNPVVNVAVIFRVSPSTGQTLTEWMDSGGRPLYTDNNGRAEDVMRTNYPRDAVQKTVTVRATVTDKFDGTTPVTIN